MLIGRQHSFCAVETTIELRSATGPRGPTRKPGVSPASIRSEVPTETDHALLEPLLSAAARDLGVRKCQWLALSGAVTIDRGHHPLTSHDPVLNALGKIVSRILEHDD